MQSTENSPRPGLYFIVLALLATFSQYFFCICQDRRIGWVIAQKYWNFCQQGPLQDSHCRSNLWSLVYLLAGPGLYLLEISISIPFERAGRASVWFHFIQYFRTNFESFDHSIDHTTGPTPKTSDLSLNPPTESYGRWRDSGEWAGPHRPAMKPHDWWNGISRFLQLREKIFQNQKPFLRLFGRIFNAAPPRSDLKMQIMFGKYINFVNPTM